MRRVTLVALLVTAVACGKKEKAEDQPGPKEGDFTVIVLPDTQYYHLKNRDAMFEQVRWIVKNREAMNIVFVIHLGDMTNNNTPDQWKTVNQVMTPLDEAGIPYTPMPGNHDGITWSVIGSQPYNKIFPVSRFEGKPWYGGHHADRNDSMYAFFEAGGVEFMVLSLAYGLIDDEIRWANEIADKYPDKQIIMSTHAYLDDDGTTLDRGEEYGVSDKKFLWNDGKKLREAFVVKHENIFMTLCGHVPDQGRATTVGEHGNTIHEILANYQGYPNGGDGYLRILRFSPRDDKIYVKAYSPSLDKTIDDPKHTFTLDYDMP